jgi:uncharacterized protein YjiS (DUF1127 family)
MTMLPNAPTATDLLTAAPTWKSVTARIAAAVRAAHARRQAVRAYKHMLAWDDDHLLRDVGLTRGDIHVAMRALDDRS